jgi:hypothetical protein
MALAHCDPLKQSYDDAGIDYATHMVCNIMRYSVPPIAAVGSLVLLVRAVLVAYVLHHTTESTALRELHEVDALEYLQEAGYQGEKEESKFVGPSTRELVTADPTKAIDGLMSFIGCNKAVINEAIQSGSTEQIVEEWKQVFSRGTAEDQAALENLYYVLEGTACIQPKDGLGRWDADKKFQNGWKRDHDEQGRPRLDRHGMKLKDFVDHPTAKNAQLTPGHGEQQAPLPATVHPLR